MDLGVKGKTALVMGASSGLGRATAEALAREGCNLIIAARSEATLEEVAADLAGRYGVTVEAFALDLADAAGVDRACGLADRPGGIDILVANSGGPPPSGALGVPEATWRSQFEQMVLAIIRIMDALVPPMRDRGWGRVVAIASSGVVQPIPTLAISNTLRASLMLYCKTLAAEVAGDGVTVNMVLPGRIKTARTDRLDAAAAERTGQSVDAIQAAAGAAIPVGRYGRPEEFGAVCAFLASARASYVTGSTIAVDGGAVRGI